MKIVIDIDDEDYKRIQDIPNAFNSLTSRAYSAIRKGTPQQTSWIPCSERMPEIRYDKYGNVSSDSVIIWCEQDSEDGKYEWYDIGFFQPATGCFQTISEEGYFLTICHISKVKAWMPLPEPYQSND